MQDQQKENIILIIGAGISGCTLAERYANLKNKKVIVIEKRDHIGGNCHDYTNNIGIKVNKFGPHYFRTNDEEVWEYVQLFSEWEPFEARVLSVVNGKKVPMPVNIDTINTLFGENIETEQEMINWLSKEIHEIEEPKSSEESALKRFGPRIYKMMFENYTKKQWDKHPQELEASVMERIPIRYNRDKRYFTEKYQMYPKNGYTRIFENMLSHPNIEIRLNTEWSEDNNLIQNCEKIFFTGRIDSYFKEKLGKLEYRSLRFEHEDINQEFFQDEVQENHPHEDTPFTRIVEYKHQTKQKNPKTTIVKEFPTWDGEPYYPVPTQENRDTYDKYKEEAKKLEEKGIYFVGRLANYKYFNMDQAFRNALDLFNRIEIN